MNIPSNIILTWKNNNVPAHVIEKWRELNPNYNVLFFTDEDIMIFLEMNYGLDYAVFFSKIPFGRYKSDFFRLCYLYKNGGCYVDIDIEPLLPIDEILNKNDNITLLSVLSLGEGHIFQAILFSEPNNVVIKMCIESMLFYGSNIGIDPKDEYPFTGHPTKCMYDNISIFLNGNVKEGLNSFKDNRIILGKETFIHDRIVTIFPGNKHFAYSRYTNYNRDYGFF